MWSSIKKAAVEMRAKDTGVTVEQFVALSKGVETTIGEEVLEEGDSFDGSPEQHEQVPVSSLIESLRC